MSYFRLVLEHPRFLAFGVALTFFSSFGQTFFISLFSEPIRETFSLTHGTFGLCYSLATLASGLAIIWLGQKIDTIDLRPFTGALCIGLTLAAFGMYAAQDVLSLILVIFLLRLTGQGLFGHTAATTMARYFDTARGKALSISSLGYPAGEAILPIVAVTLTASLGWRETWLGISAMLLLCVTPLALWLLRGHSDRHAAHLLRLKELADAEDEADAHAAQLHPHTIRPRLHWSRGEVVRDVRFYLLLPTVTAPGFIVTGMFFHQVHLTASKGWSLSFFATCFAAFAAAQLPAGLLAGPLVDRFSSRRLLPLLLLPLMLGLLVLAFSSHTLIAPLFMILIGLTSGVTGTIIGSMWAEVYGVKHLGAIRSMATAIMVFGTAGSPLLMGLLIDRSVSIELIALGSAGWCVIGMCTAWIAMRR